MAKEKGNLILAIIVVVCFTAVIAMGLYLIYDKSLFTKEQVKSVACTQEVKLCPDGSNVGRIGPNCAFAACPIVKVPVVKTPVVEINETDSWLTYKNDKHGFEIKYPPSWIFYDIDDDFLVMNFCGPDYATKSDCKTAGLNHTSVISLRNDIVVVKDGGYCANYPNSIYCKKELILVQENLKIDNRDAEVIEIRYGTDNDKNDLIVFWKNDSSDKRMYGLEVFKNYPEYSSVFNKMIFTFKFNQ